MVEIFFKCHSKCPLKSHHPPLKIEAGTALGPSRHVKSSLKEIVEDEKAEIFCFWALGGFYYPQNG
jgi:hypothetical protein